MNAFPMLALAFAAFGSPLFAQQAAEARLHPITAPVKYAGVYHLGTGTWTMPGSGGAGAPTSGSGAAILFDNTCVAGYTSSSPTGARFYDEGRLPSPTSPVQANGYGLGNDSERGTQASYAIDGFQLGYCTSTPAAVGYTIRFYEAYEACAVAPAVPTASFALTGLPGAAIAGSQSCWILDIDLCASSQSFAMLADADQVYDGTAGGLDDTFGWSWELTTAALAGDGYIIAGGSLTGGSFTPCSGSDGTLFDSGTISATYPANSEALALGCGTLAAGASPEAGSGMGTLDRFRIENYAPLQDGCYWFGGNPLGSFYLQLYSADVALPGSATASSFCEPALGGVIPCPCGNPASGAQRGCDNSAATGGASLSASGSATLAADTLVFATAGEPADVTTMLVQGTSGASGAQRGQGVRCVGGTLRILYVHAAAGGGISVPSPAEPSVSARSAALGDVIGAGTARYYFAIYRDPNVVGGCSAVSTFNCTNANAVLWN